VTKIQQIATDDKSEEHAIKDSSNNRLTNQHQSVFAILMDKYPEYQDNNCSIGSINIRNNNRNISKYPQLGIQRPADTIFSNNK
jgi:hypothetical protein